MLIVQSAVAIYMLVLVPRAATDFKEAFKNYDYRCEDTKFVDDIQDRSYCCGIYSYHDYQEILDILIPGSCCNNSWGVCTAEDVGFRPGCAFRLNTSRLIHQVYLTSIFILTVTVTVLIGFLFALYLTNSIKERNAVKRQETYTLLHGNNANKIFPTSS
ncbi:uncharacterized protein LOC143897161 [Temnothorax americanus]|uniref:uncharacterized protein LOC143897161 n=1 Tax=Temnothorax americanus TaxID=1964332 RepID=UPI0040684E28